MTETIQNSLKEHRLASNMTQQDLAKATGVSRQSIISIERGRYVPSLTLALRLAALFGQPVEELFHLAES